MASSPPLLRSRRRVSRARLRAQTSCGSAFPALRPPWPNQAQRSVMTPWSRDSKELLSPDGNFGNPWVFFTPSSSRSFFLFEAFSCYLSLILRPCFPFRPGFASIIFVLRLIAFAARALIPIHIFIQRLLVCCIRDFGRIAYILYASHIIMPLAGCQAFITVYSLNKRVESLHDLEMIKSPSFSVN